MALGTPLGTQALWYDPCAFTIAHPGFLGSVGRNTLRGPGFINVDFSVSKNTALKFLGEAGGLEFRAEVFNILNHANFALPNRTVFTASAAVEKPANGAALISTTVGNSRQIQLALKLIF